VLSVSIAKSLRPAYKQAAQSPLPSSDLQILIQAQKPSVQMRISAKEKLRIGKTCPCIPGPGAGEDDKDGTNRPRLRGIALPTYLPEEICLAILKEFIADGQVILLTRR
jgi:hypothetical protein